MSIRIKTLLIAGISIIALIITVSAISTKIVLDGVNKLEASLVQTNTQRVGEAINAKIDYLRTKSADWAYWDDTYNFVTNHNPQYVATNLVPESFINIQVDSIVYLDTKGTIVYAKMFDSTTQTVSSASADLIEATQQINKRLIAAPVGTDISGLLLLPEGPMYITARQILHSDNTGPIHGVLLLSELFDAEEIARLANVTKTRLAVHRLDQQVPPHDQQMVQELSQGKSFDFSLLSDTDVSGYSLQKDVNNKNILLLDVVQNRDYYQEGLRDIKILLIGFGCAGVIFLVIVLIILDRLVLTPLVHLRINVDHVTGSGDASLRIPDIGSRDELGALARDLNKMLESLEKSRQQVKVAETKSQTYIDAVGVIAVIISSDQKIVLLNKRGCEVLEVSPNEVVGKNWFDTFIPQDKREQMKAVFAEIFQGKIDTYGIHENEIITKSGKRRLIAWRNNVVKDEKGSIVATVSSGEDITEIKESQEKAVARARELEELNKTMVGRELKMIELKNQIEAQVKEISELKAKLGQT